MLGEPQEWITQRVCADRIGVSEETVRELVSIGAVCYRNGTDFRALVIQADVERVLASRSSFLLRTNRILDDPWSAP